MRRSLLLGGVIVAISAMVTGFVQSQSKPDTKASPADQPEKGDGKSASTPDRSADETIIRANIAQFVKAYNAGNVSAVAAFFAPDGQTIDKEGNEAKGRDAIAKTFARVFEATPKKQLEVFVDSIRFIGPDLAVEVGSTKETPAPGEPPEYDRYTVLHVKRDGKWQMALARDEEGPTATAHEQLQSLAWLVGEWVDDGGSAVVFSSCRWSDDKNFLLQDFKLELNGRDAMDVTQRIGWDPLAKQIRSWVFDSEGGFGETLWTRDGNGWIIKATGVRPDGTTASATNLLTRIGTDGYVWRSTDRIVAGEPRPPIAVKVVRKPPQPRN